MSQRSEFAHLFTLPIAERLQLVEELWDSIAADSEALPLPEWQLDELKRRAARHDADPASALSWDQVKQHMRKSTP